MKIVVLGGGISTERHVALVTATSVCKALRSRGHQAIFVDMFLGMEGFDAPLETAFDVPDGFCGQVAIEHTAPDLAAVKASRKDKSASRLGKNVLEICRLADCVFLGLHGADGEDGKIQATLDLLGVPYTGSGPLGSAMAMDKAVTKRIVGAAGVRTPAWRELTYSEADIPALRDSLPVPCVVKVVGGGSSIGVALPDTREQLEQALHDILKYGSRVLIEQKIIGRELTVSTAARSARSRSSRPSAGALTTCPSTSPERRARRSSVPRRSRKRKSSACARRLWPPIRRWDSRSIPAPTLSWIGRASSGIWRPTRSPA